MLNNQGIIFVWNLQLSCIDALFAVTHKDARLRKVQQSTVSQEQNPKL